jgi:adenine-specific DNA-methyltransferase
LDYLLWYGRDQDQTKFRELFVEKSDEAGTAENYNWIELPDGQRRTMRRSEKTDPGQLPAGARVFQPADISSQGNPVFEFEYGGKTFSHPWKTTSTGLQRLGWARRFHQTPNSLRYIRYLRDFPYVRLTQLWQDTAIGSFTEKKIFVVQTPTKVIQRCLLLSTDPGDLVLDPTCGSGTAAYVAEQWGRRWITIDTSRVALALARTRLMTGKFPYYLLADSSDGAQKQAEVDQQIAGEGPFDNDVRKGFVYKTVPHVTLKSIAHNPDITEGMSRNAIDAAIARHADGEVLYDQPYEDKSRLRVTGPFTVESLSPHRSVEAAADPQDKPVSEWSDIREDAGQFEDSILENLRKAGIGNTKKDEKLVFDRLEPYAGQGWLHAEGDYTEKDGTLRRVAVSIGPEHGTVGKTQIKKAAMEAVRGVGFDLLVVCGFAFDPDVDEEKKAYGKLRVEVVRMNPDLAMGDELLKKTGSGNLFMIFGEPDLDIKDEGDGQISVELLGLDVYDPTTGQVRASSTDDIACWFIDTAYNNEAFFVRHAYFTGADKPYEKLKRALKAEIDEAAWSSLYSTRSRPFPKPDTNRIAVKVINHYGDEVLKVYEV